MNIVAGVGREIHTLFEDFDALGIRNANAVYWNLTTGALYEEAVRRSEGLIAHHGPLVVRTGHHTGRSPNDKFVVQDKTTDSLVNWGPVNQPFTPEAFERLYTRLLAYLQGKDLFIQDCLIGQHPKARVTLRVITESAWHSLFARNLFIRLLPGQTLPEKPSWTLIQAPRFHAIPEIDHTRQEVFVILNFARRLVLIGGTSYAGEIKKAMFSVANFLYPQMGILSMHCSANVGKEGDTALFFGLSGTGKTSLSADPERALIGDDEHGWADEGVFNIEGGCYAKTINLSKQAEPVIYACTRRLGTVLENVSIDTQTRRLDLDDASLTENTRAAYPLSYVTNAYEGTVAGHPKVIFLLTCDAFGVLPPIAKLTPEQAMAHFLLGYTAKVAGTEKGLGSEPQATFSACFGAPFLPLAPKRYAELFKERTQNHEASIYLVNTGWINGPFGVGERIPIPYTRAMIRGALSGVLEKAGFQKDSAFGLMVPNRVEGVPEALLMPKNTWPDPKVYENQAKVLLQRFREQAQKLGIEADDLLA